MIIRPRPQLFVKLAVILGLLTKAFTEAEDGRIVRNASAQHVGTADWRADTVIVAIWPLENTTTRPVRVLLVAIPDCASGRLVINRLRFIVAAVSNA